MALKAIDGLPVFDAKDSLTINITKQDIDKADPKHPESCAAARACMRQLHAKEARVHLGRVYIKTTPDHWIRFLTPQNLRSEIIAFDRGGVFEPGQYVLPAPQPSKLLGTPGKIRKRSMDERLNAKKRRPPTIVKNVRTGPA